MVQTMAGTEHDALRSADAGPRRVLNTITSSLLLLPRLSLQMRSGAPVPQTEGTGTECGVRQVGQIGAPLSCGLWVAPQTHTFIHH